MRHTVLSMLTGSTMLVATVVGMPSSAQSQTVVIINGNQPYYPQPYPYPYPNHHVVYDAPDYYADLPGDYAGYGYDGGYGCPYGGYYGRPYYGGWGWRHRHWAHW